MQILLIFAIFWPALAGVGLWFLPSARADRHLRGQLYLLALGLELLAAMLLAFGQGTELTLLTMAPNLALYFKVDAVGALFAILQILMWLASCAYALEYLAGDPHEASYQALFAAVLSALVGQCFAGSMVTLYVFYELMTLLSVPMVVHERTPQAVAAGIKYLVYSIFGATIGLLGIFIFQRAFGTVDFVPGGHAQTLSAGLQVMTFLVILGFGTKAGLFPMHGWLPTAHPVAPACASAVLSGVITKAGVLAILRLLYFLVGPAALAGTWVQQAFAILTLITILMGSMLAYREPLLKRRLAYSTVSQVSYVLFGLALFTPDALSGGLLHVVAHSVIKDALFLCAGAFIHQTGKTRVAELRGVGKSMPITLWCWTIAALGLIGIPPTAGFVSKWLLAEGALSSPMTGIALAGPIVLILSALLTAAYLLQVTILGFFPGKGEACVEGAGDPGWEMLVPQIGLAALVLLAGVLASFILGAFGAGLAAIL